MNKIASYLNEHILGEVSSQRAIRRRYSQDGSILSITPELVVFAKTTNDIRKIARFTWQLAERGHVIALTPRGNGTDTTGAAIGHGVIINTSAHLNKILHVGPKERVVHAQSGANLRVVNDTLMWHGMSLLNFPVSSDYATVGGAIANDASGETGTLGSSVQQLEVVLANGDLIETKRINRREVSKKQGLQTLEGEIYRKLDGIIDDNADLIKSLGENNRYDHAGYASIASVRDKDGSFDLTPLFIGSQGTLGIISEAVLKLDFFRKGQSVVVAAMSKEKARDIADSLVSLQPSVLEIIDGKLFEEAIKNGKRYSSLTDLGDVEGGALLYTAFDDFSDRVQSHKVKKALKILNKENVKFISSKDIEVDDLAALRGVGAFVALSLGETEALPPVIDGASIPFDQLEVFMQALEELASKVHTDLPTRINALTGFVTVYPRLKLGEISDKQKVLRMINEYSQLVNRLGGTFIAEDGEGRLKVNAAWALMDEKTQELYKQIREVFDPFGTLNPGVKQPGEMKHLVEALRQSHDMADLIERGLTR